MDGSILALAVSGRADWYRLIGVVPLMDPDAQFFTDHPSRRVRIRLPAKQLHRDQQRAVRYLDEQELPFRSLGPHDVKRRRIIAYRLPPDHPQAPNHVMQIPFLAFSDEEIADRDDILLPIVHQIMKDAAK